MALVVKYGTCREAIGRYLARGATDPRTLSGHHDACDDARERLATALRDAGAVKPASDADVEPHIQAILGLVDFVANAAADAAGGDLVDGDAERVADQRESKAREEIKRELVAIAGTVDGLCSQTIALRAQLDAQAQHLQNDREQREAYARDCARLRSELSTATSGQREAEAPKLDDLLELVRKFGHATLFASGGDPTAKDIERREEAWNAVQDGLTALAVEIVTAKSLRTVADRALAEAQRLEQFHRNVAGSALRNREALQAQLTAAQARAEQVERASQSWIAAVKRQRSAPDEGDDELSRAEDALIAALSSAPEGENNNAR